MVNEFHTRRFDCAAFIPTGSGYETVEPQERACAVPGAVAGANFVDGTAYVETAFGYQWGNRWRNFGIIVAFIIGLCIAHLVMCELVASEASKGEVLVFRRSKMQKKGVRQHTDEESGSMSSQQLEKPYNNNGSGENVQKQVSIFHWEKVNYEVQIKGETRKILNNVDGWIKPGTLTALMACYVLTLVYILG